VPISCSIAVGTCKSPILGLRDRSTVTLGVFNRSHRLLPEVTTPMSDAESIQQTCIDVIQSLILAFSNRYSVVAGTRTNKFARGGIDPLRSCLARHIIQRQWTCGEQVVSLLSSLWGSQFCKVTTRARFKAVILSSTSSSASCVALRQRRHGRREID
jgi:hypothetical protein